MSYLTLVVTDHGPPERSHQQRVTKADLDREIAELGVSRKSLDREWDPEREEEPAGWIRHVQSGRRRPEGDSSKEYINP